MSIIFLSADPAVLPATYNLFRETKRNKNISIDYDFQASVDPALAHDREGTKKYTKNRLWRWGTRESSKSQSSIGSLGQRVHAKLTRIISGGSRLRDALHYRNHSDHERLHICVTEGPGNIFEASEYLSDEALENMLDDPRLSDDTRQQAGALLRQRGFELATYAIHHMILPI